MESELFILAATRAASPAAQNERFVTLQSFGAESMRGFLKAGAIKPPPIVVVLRFDSWLTWKFAEQAVGGRAQLRDYILQSRLLGLGERELG